MAVGAKNVLFDDEFLAGLRRLHLIAKHVSAGSGAGRRRSRRMGDGLEFADHRAYAPGDDIRFIDWPYFARMEKLLLRLFHEHSESEVTVLLDASASMAPGGRTEKFDYARRVAAALAYVAMGSLERVGLVPFSETPRLAMRTTRNREQILEVLEFLSEIQPGGRTDLAGCAEWFVRRHRAPGTVIIISDLLDSGEALDEALARLRTRGDDVTVMQVYSPDDTSPRLDGPALLSHAETHQRLSVPGGREVLESYRRRWMRFRRACERTTVARGALYAAAPADVPFEKLLLHTLTRIGVLGRK